MSDQSKVESTRQLLVNAQEKGFGSTLGAYFKLSGPGWLQSAITLGGGSLAGALFLGALGGTNLLWLQMLAITMGVIMLSAISYVTLSTGERPFQAINKHINPVLGWGWLIATCTANMIWCMPQFSLAFAALEKNLVGPDIGGTNANKLSISLNIFLAALFVVLLSSRGGRAAKFFDYFLKALVGTIVVCFFGVVVYLGANGYLDWNGIFRGFIPDFRQWSQPTGEVANLVGGLSTDGLKDFWTGKVVTSQRDIMIGAAATAVGINMTFLMPYAMLSRGWNKPFRGLARFDLCTGMAIPYILVTSCVVIAAAQSFHGKVDDKFLSSDKKVMQESSLFNGAKDVLVARVQFARNAAIVLPKEDAEKKAAFDAWKVLAKDAEKTKADSFDDLSESQQREAAVAPAALAEIKALSEDEKQASFDAWNLLSKDAKKSEAKSFDDLPGYQQKEAVAARADLSEIEAMSDDEKKAAFEAWKVLSKDAKKSKAESFDELLGYQKQEAIAAPALLADVAALPDDEKRIAGSVVKRDAFQLSAALAPLFGEEHGQKIANVIFGIGIFGMGFSTIIILMLINGYAFTEMLGKPQGGAPHVIGCVVAGLAGASWPFFWGGESKVWLAILVSSFGMMLLPIAYFTFFMMMNNRKLMGDEKPTGVRMGIWNVLMGISVIGAVVAAGSAIYKESVKPVTGLVVISIGAAYVVLVIIGFVLKFRSKGDPEDGTGDADEKAATADT